MSTIKVNRILTSSGGEGVDADIIGNVTGNVTAPASVTVGLTTFHSTTGLVHNINSTGVITATSFSGDGSSLTGISAGYWQSTSAGINTTSNVGIGTTNPGQKLTVFDSGTSTVRITSGDSEKATLQLNVNNSAIAFQSTYLTGGSAARDFVFYDVGNERVRVSAAGRVSLAGDTNTYLSHPASDTLAVTTNDGERLRITSSGAVGIGTINPPYDLSLHTTGTTELQIHSSQNNGHSYLRMTGEGTTPAQIIYFGDTASATAGNITYTHTDNTLQVQSSEDIKLKPNNGNSGINIIGGGEVELYHNNVVMAETVDTGLLSHGDYLVGTPGASTEKVIATANHLNLYLSNSGDDNNDGRSSSNPIRTIARAWALMPKARWPGQAVNLYFEADFEHTGSPYLVGPSPGDDVYGPYVRFIGSGAQRTITMNGRFHFRDVHGIRFESLKFSTSGNQGYGMTFRDCVNVKFYSDCDWVSTATSGWSALMDITRCTSFTCDMDWDLQSSSTAGLGAVIVCSNSDVYFTGSLTKTGTKWGNTAVSVVNGSYWAGGLNVTNFATGYYFGVNHYNAESGARGMLISSTISNCTTGIILRNNSFVRKYAVTYSGNSQNESILTNGGNFT